MGDRVISKTQVYFWLAVILLLCGIISWVPYLIFDIQKPYGMFTFFLNSIGLVFGSLSNNKLVAWGNLLMIFSVIPVVIFVYLTKGYIPM